MIWSEIPSDGWPTTTEAIERILPAGKSIGAGIWNQDTLIQYAMFLKGVETRAQIEAVPSELPYPVPRQHDETYLVGIICDIAESDIFQLPRMKDDIENGIKFLNVLLDDKIVAEIQES